jgi:hypothetical protein
LSAGALHAVNAILERGGEPDDILRAVVEALVEGGCGWSGILFAEGGELMLGPEAGTAVPEARIELPVVFQGTNVAALAADGCDDKASLEQIAILIAPYCLVGWDTGGVPWEGAGA